MDKGPIHETPSAVKKPFNRKRAVIFLSIGVVLVFAVILPQTSFDLPFLNPGTNQQLLFFASLSVLIFLLFVALTFVLARNLLKLFAERRMGVLGSTFRTRLVVASLLLSFLPTIIMFWFSYGLMNRSIDKWFSLPVEEVRQETGEMASLLSDYASQNARAEAGSIAGSSDVQHAFDSHDEAALNSALLRHQNTLQGGFAVALADGEPLASYGLPATWSMIKIRLPLEIVKADESQKFVWAQTDYMVGRATLGQHETIIVAMPLPKTFSTLVQRVNASQQRYIELSHERRLLRRTYMDLLLLLTVLVLFATTWLALYLSKLVTRPVAALAAATQEISRGRLDYRVDVPAADEMGELVHSFNRMAEELETNRKQINDSSRELEQRRRHIETILESIPTGVLSLDADRRITHVNHALLRLFHSAANQTDTPAVLIGARLQDVFMLEMMQEIEPLLRRADRMGTTTTQMELQVRHTTVNVAATVARLQHEGLGLGHVLVFEDLSDLLKGQKQAAWREVARRVAHEIKNPLTPIALSADRIRRHLSRRAPSDPISVEIIDSSAKTIESAVETVRTLVNEFSTLARFPSAQPQPNDINSIARSALALFEGRMEGVRIVTLLQPELPLVLADAESMKRALANLIDNAAESMQDSPLREIQVTTMLVTSSDAVEIVVADTGHGVTPALKEKLFLPYFSTKQRGTGLGLAIVSRIIEDHNGSIRVEENEPHGARFIIELPLATNPTAPSLVNQNA
jgi:two-component system, NtrC family, nitrogen regulation sensor histidine kinase NtrY